MAVHPLVEARALEAPAVAELEGRHEGFRGVFVKGVRGDAEVVGCLADVHYLADFGDEQVGFGGVAHVLSPELHFVWDEAGEFAVAPVVYPYCVDISRVSSGFGSVLWWEQSGCDQLEQAYGLPIVVRLPCSPRDWAVVADGADLDSKEEKTQFARRNFPGSCNSDRERGFSEVNAHRLARPVVCIPDKEVSHMTRVLSQRKSRNMKPRFGSAVRRGMALGLCVVLSASTLPALETAPAVQKPGAVKHGLAKSMAADERAIHLLSRFAFGPTEADLAEVERLGVDGWFEEQLHPERIADTGLATRLEQFPALKMPVNDLLWRFPDGAAIRQAANGKREVPADPALKAVYERHIALYEAKQEKKAGKTMDGKTAASGGMAPPAAGKAAGNDSEDVRLADAATVTAVLKLAPEARVKRVMAMGPEEFSSLRSAVKGPQLEKLTEGMTPEQREMLEDFENPTQTVVQEEQAQRLLRDIYSSRQLQEVMTGFWMNHFNVYLHKNEQEPYYLVSYERDVIRPQALGNFEDLLIATAESPAMLLYLDNSASTGPDSQAAERQKMRAAQGKVATPPGLNENYARELMELHTLGVNGGYTQKDVTEVAKVFTGWTVEKQQFGGGFFFDAARHEPGAKTVLGKKIKDGGSDGGMQEGLEVLHMLATSPATARFVSRELAVAFVSDAPSDTLVSRMAKSFTASQGDIKTVLRTMVHAPEFWSETSYRAKVKTPLEYVVSAARASGAEVGDARPLVNALNQMGMPLYGCVPPTGYADKAADWVSTGALVTRMNFALTLATNRYPQVKTPWVGNLNTAMTDITPGQTEVTLERKLIAGGVSPKTRAAILEQVMNANTGTGPVKEPAGMQASQKQVAGRQWQTAQMAGLLMGSPEFQRR